jgi:WD40 repeat protein
MDLYEIEAINISDYELAPKVDSKLSDIFKCALCLGLARKPVNCLQCEGIFCEVCITQAQSTNRTCPLCRSPLKTKKIQKGMPEVLDDILVLCPSGNCSADIKYKDILTHMQVCPFTQRYAICTGCKFKSQITLTDPSAILTHIDNCLDSPDPCVYCKNYFKRRFLNTHMQTCDYQELPCKYCDKIMKKMHFNTHSKDECFKKVLNKYNSLLESKEIKIEELEEEVIKLNNDLYSYKGKVENKFFDTTCKFLKQTLTGNSKQTNAHLGQITSVIQLKEQKDSWIIVTGSHDSTIKAWDIKNDLQPTKTIQCKSAITALLYLENMTKTTTTIISGSITGEIKLWNWEHSICLKTLDDTGSAVTSLIQIKWKFDSQTIASSSIKEIKLWDLDTYSIFRVIDISSTLCLTYLKWEENDITFLSGSSENICFWNIVKGTCIKNLKGHKGQVTCLTQKYNTEDNPIIFSGSIDLMIRIWDVIKGTCLNTLIGHSDTITKFVQLNFSKEETILVSASRDMSIRSWDLNKYACLGTIKHDHAVNDILLLNWDKDETVLVCVTGDNVDDGNKENNKIFLYY